MALTGIAPNPRLQSTAGLAIQPRGQFIGGIATNIGPAPAVPLAQQQPQPPIAGQVITSNPGQLSANQPQQGQIEPAIQQAQQPFGLAGAEQALQGGALAGVNAIGQGQLQALNTLQFGNQAAQSQLQQGRAALGGNFNASAQQVDPNTGQPLFQQAAAGVGAFSPAGLQAQGLQSALSGAQGQQAFDQAFIDSPVQQFLREQGEQSRINQAAATGGIGGGAIQQELTRFGQGLAGTQLQQQIQNLGALSGQGLQAAGLQGGFLSQAGQQQGNLASTNAQLGTQANIASASNRLGAAQGQANLFGQGAGTVADLTSQGAGFQFGAGQGVANLLSGAGQDIGQARFQTGRDLASQIGQSTSALSNLANQQGSGLSDIIGAGGSNLANLLSGAGQLDAAQQTQLAQLLANLSTGQGSQLSNIALGQGNANAQAALAAGANQQQLLGNLAGAFGQFQGQQSPSTNRTPAPAVTSGNR